MPLAPEVEKAAAKALLELMPIWLGLPLTDYRRVFRPTGPGAHSIAIEPYRGSSTWIDFDKYLRSSGALDGLRHAIADFQPELAGHLVLPGRSMHLTDTTALFSAWCHALARDQPKADNLAPLVHRLLCDFSVLLDCRVLKHRVSTSISGLRLPSQQFSLALPDNAVLRSMSDDELSELSSHDITFGRDKDVLSYSVSSCLVYESESPFRLEPTPAQELLTSTVDVEAHQYTVDVLRALHVLKAGRAGIFLATSELTPSLLPFLNGFSSFPLYRPPFASLELTPEDVVPFIEILRSLRAGIRDEVRIAVDRLVDAEARLSPVDALVDAAIGLEVLLNPMDTAELAFRVALNYAHLGTPELRRERYDRIRTIQKTRNRVVHGGLNIQSQGAPLIHDHAGLAKACLRDAVKSFLLDSTLTGNKKLDAEFWLDRILPANIVPAIETPPTMPE